MPSVTTPGGVRTRTALVGSALALTAGLLADHGAVLGADLPKTALFGAAAGAVLGLVPDRSPAPRALAFLAGFVAAWVGYGLRAGYLPDIPAGRAIAAVVVVGLVTAVATTTAGRLPLWAGLLGAATLLGSYETTFAADPAAFVEQSMTAATTVLLTAALGFLVASVLQEWQPVLAPAPAPAPVRDEVEVEVEDSAIVPGFDMHAPRPTSDVATEVTR
jgi:hypothetical protein